MVEPCDRLVQEKMGHLFRISKEANQMPILHICGPFLKV